MLKDYTADGKASDDDCDADFNDGPDLGAVVFVGDVLEGDFDDVGYADDGDDNVAVWRGEVVVSPYNLSCFVENTLDIIWKEGGFLTYKIPRAKIMLNAILVPRRMCSLQTMNCGRDQRNVSYRIVHTALAIYVFFLAPFSQCPPSMVRSQL